METYEILLAHIKLHFRQVCNKELHASPSEARTRAATTKNIVSVRYTGIYQNKQNVILQAVFPPVRLRSGRKTRGEGCNLQSE